MMKSIFLILNTELSLTRQIFHGITEYGRTVPDWDLRLISFRAPQPVPDLVSEGAAGAIGHVVDGAVASAMSTGRVPWVNVSNYPLEPAWPVVTNHDARVGALVAHSLIERGFRHFAYVMLPWGGGSFMERGLGFMRAVEAAGGSWHCYPSAITTAGSGARGNPVPADMGRWLASLPKPLGVLACNDDWGEQVIDQCKAHGLAVPEDVAVVGVDNDDIRCELAPVPLSSVALGTRRIGFEAAALLDRLMRGEAAPRQRILIDPIGVVVRRSSDVLAVDDPDVAAAVRYIAAHASEPIDVQDVARATAVSRRALERRFRRALGRTPHDEVQRVHVARARELLAETDLPLPAVAKASGFMSRERMGHVFRQLTGTTPAAYRKGRR
ncbi:MAG TPA: DNA-binding transcriptional regulator [Tepidisphaeraceae bacterium]|nr:DNA-binding transcriptional regulator [Tepidisphaeraceae bacterium]